MTPEQEAAEAEAWFTARKFRLHTYREGQSHWTDLIAERSRFKATKYGRGNTPEASVVRAKRRWDEEQGTD